ncbi:hypothetical protein HDU85_006022 [Gaertneriomyces sp. JEL0708]|nr:hypothetical protein HDU85_006022 [Gaertneriomyces sp. JEL0708]
MQSFAEEDAFVHPTLDALPAQSTDERAAVRRRDSSESWRAAQLSEISDDMGATEMQNSTEAVYLHTKELVDHSSSFHGEEAYSTSVKPIPEILPKEILDERSGGAEGETLGLNSATTVGTASELLYVRSPDGRELVADERLVPDEQAALLREEYMQVILDEPQKSTDDTINQRGDTLLDLTGSTLKHELPSAAQVVPPTDLPLCIPSPKIAKSHLGSVGSGHISSPLAQSQLPTPTHTSKLPVPSSPKHPITVPVLKFTPLSSPTKSPKPKGKLRPKVSLATNLQPNLRIPSSPHPSLPNLHLPTLRPPRTPRRKRPQTSHSHETLSPHAMPLPITRPQSAPDPPKTYSQHWKRMVAVKGTGRLAGLVFPIQ